MSWKFLAELCPHSVGQARAEVELIAVVVANCPHAVFKIDGVDDACAAIPFTPQNFDVVGVCQFELELAGETWTPSRVRAR